MTASPSEIVAATAARGRRIETPLSGRPLVWHAFGEGRPLVLLHGGYGSWTHWIRNVEPLARTRLVLVPDMPGFGDSGDPEDMFTAQSVTAPVLAGLEAIIGPATPFDIAAFSFGGSVAGLIAASQGKRVGHVVLVGSGGLRLPRAPQVELRNISLLKDPAAIMEAHRANLGIFMFHRPASVDELSVHLQAANVARARVKSRRISRMGVLHDALPQISARLVGIWGEEDVISKGHLDEREALLKSHDPEARFHRLAGAGHWVQYENADEVNAILATELSLG
ncbi:alpha/beta hydrolase fold protein [Ancylobacter novellus DSM 506]|uniref:Alpha/beta hydrolase fold protein n=1 Tax=Ancylobacter novellus (strain ATCC 8093 / DSM 506 / JCM 20403 / CCM 1077 / IAM 12100 / NBRC 12443 / NCIMB 10456) TaxID=639283 RepID=D7A1L3_ANCN5|nr:alpha/beta fold hydrolase [Ancylobacter novellus]ADH91438.1 alpha/beta hydrolase fold protein [Ancylobacter novellus DSM 506]